MITPIKTAHGYLSVQPDGRLEFRQAVGSWELFDFEGFTATQPVPPTPQPPQPTDPMNPQPNADYVARVKAALTSQGYNLSGPCGAFLITKHVAWGLRAQGYGLLSKPQGNNCDGYATDIVMSQNAGGDIVDVLGDAGNANVPNWAVTDTVDIGRWRPAVQP